MTTEQMTHRSPAAGGSKGRGAGPWPASDHAARARAAALAFAIVYVVARLVPLGAQLDERVRGGHDAGSVAAQWSADLLSLLTPVSVVTAALVLCIIAWRRSGLRASVETALAVALAPGLAETLKALLPAVSDRAGAHLAIGSSFPSGHVAAVTALCLALLAVLPTSSAPPSGMTWGAMLRAPVVLLPFVVGVATVLVGWHRPGDVVGGVLIAIVAHHGVRALTRRATTGPRSARLRA